MSDKDGGMPSLLSTSLSALSVEDLVAEALRDMMKDEIRSHIRKRLEQDPRLKAEMRSAIDELLEAKVREAYAMVRLGKCGAELGVLMVPEDMRRRIEKDLAGLLEKEMGRLADEM